MTPGPDPDDEEMLNKLAQDAKWATRAKNLLRAEMVKRGLNYAQLAEKLEAIGVHDNERNLANKIARGSFTAAFLLQCLNAIGASTLHLDA
jgi:Domain of unknown function (DUF6471)